MPYCLRILRARFVRLFEQMMTSTTNKIDGVRAALAGLRAGAPPAIRAALGEAGLDKRRQLPARRLSAGQRRRIGQPNRPSEGSARRRKDAGLLDSIIGLAPAP